MNRLRRVIRAGKILLRDDRTPRWVKPLAVLALAPVPGPFDEIVGAVVCGVLAIRYRPLLREAWGAAK